MSLEMTTKDAVRHVLLLKDGPSKYRLACLLGMSGAIMIDRYLKSTRMGIKPAEKMLELFDIVITDTFDPRSKTKEELS